MKAQMSNSSRPVQHKCSTTTPISIYHQLAMSKRSIVLAFTLPKTEILLAQVRRRAYIWGFRPSIKLPFPIRALPSSGPALRTGTTCSCYVPLQ